MLSTDGDGLSVDGGLASSGKDFPIEVVVLIVAVVVTIVVAVVAVGTRERGGNGHAQVTMQSSDDTWSCA